MSSRKIFLQLSCNKFPIIFRRKVLNDVKLMEPIYENQLLSPALPSKQYYPECLILVLVKTIQNTSNYLVQRFHLFFCSFAVKAVAYTSSFIQAQHWAQNLFSHQSKLIIVSTSFIFLTEFMEIPQLHACLKQLNHFFHFPSSKENH